MGHHMHCTCSQLAPRWGSTQGRCANATHTPGSFMDCNLASNKWHPKRQGLASRVVQPDALHGSRNLTSYMEPNLTNTCPPAVGGAARAWPCILPSRTCRLLGPAHHAPLWPASATCIARLWRAHARAPVCSRPLTKVQSPVRSLFKGLPIVKRVSLPLDLLPDPCLCSLTEGGSACNP